eukprot:COSAG01_NODE_1511_length_10068_cov_7.643731_12_plen_108_part_00
MMREKGGEVGEASRAHVEDLGGDRTLAEPACARRNLVALKRAHTAWALAHSLCGSGAVAARTVDDNPNPRLLRKASRLVCGQQRSWPQQHVRRTPARATDHSTTAPE